VLAEDGDLLLWGELTAVGFCGLGRFHDGFSGSGFSNSPAPFFQFHQKHYTLFWDRLYVEPVPKEREAGFTG
jgi:hypothetical protein